LIGRKPILRLVEDNIVLDDTKETKIKMIEEIEKTD
jgi:hypothetical protein